VATLNEVFLDIRGRLVEMCQEAVPQSDAGSFPSSVNNYAIYSWTFRILAVVPGQPSGAGRFADTLQIALIFKGGPVGADYPGNIEDLIQWTFIPDTLSYFRKRRNLVYTSGQRPPDGMSGDLTISNQGLRTQPKNDGSDQQEWITQFTIAIPINTEEELCHA
jgi:hypothetical protein